MATQAQTDRAIVYRDAAVEHVATAFQAYRDARQVPANYFAGLSAECMLRAYRHMIDPEFDARHDLDKLYQLAKFADVVPPERVPAFDSLLGTVIALWSNEHRFLSEAALRRKWKKMKLDRHIRGDFVKEWNRRLISAANELVTLGAAQWKSSFKS